MYIFEIGSVNGHSHVNFLRTAFNQVHESDITES